MIDQFIAGFIETWASLKGLVPEWDAHSMGVVAGCLSFGAIGGLAFKLVWWISDRRITNRIQRERALAEGGD